MTFATTNPPLARRRGPRIDPGLLCMILAMLLLPVGDTLSKLLVAEMDPLAVTLWRLLAQGAALLAAAAVLGRLARGDGAGGPILSRPAALRCHATVQLVSKFGRWLHHQCRPRRVAAKCS